MRKPAFRISLSDEIQSLRQRLLKRFARASLLSAQKGFHFGEGHFNSMSIMVQRNSSFSLFNNLIVGFDKITQCLCRFQCLRILFNQ